MIINRIAALFKLAHSSAATQGSAPDHADIAIMWPRTILARGPAWPIRFISYYKQRFLMSKTTGTSIGFLCCESISRRSGTTTELLSTESLRAIVRLTRKVATLSYLLSTQLTLMSFGFSQLIRARD